MNLIYSIVLHEARHYSLRSVPLVGIEYLSIIKIFEGSNNFFLINSFAIDNPTIPEPMMINLNLDISQIISGINV